MTREPWALEDPGRWKEDWLLGVPQLVRRAVGGSLLAAVVRQGDEGQLVVGVGKAAGVELLGLPLVFLSVVCEGFCAGAKVLNHAMLEGVRRVVVALASEGKRAADIHAPAEEQVVEWLLVL